MYDLIVCGGGFTGVAGAVAAAKSGLKVLLLEKSGYLGGAACNCYVNPFFLYRIRKNGEFFTVNGGLFTEILERLDSLGGLHPNRGTFNEECLKLVLDQMVTEAGVEVLFHALLTDVETKGSNVTRVTISTKNGPLSFAASYFLDATGDGDLCAKAGCDFRVGREEDRFCQPMTLCFRISNIDIEKLKDYGYDNMQAAYVKAREEGKIKNPRENILTFDHVAPGTIHFNTTRIVGLDPLDIRDLSKAEMTGRAQMLEMYRFLKKNIPGFEDSVLLASAPEIGVRESRMILGDYTFTSEELLAGTKFEDSICAGAYPVDIHSPDGTGTIMKWLPEGEYYTIPYRSLTPIGKDNLLVAGRCISSTHEAQSAYRVMCICCTMGQAAGIALSMAFHRGCTTREIDVQALRRLLKENDLLC